MIKPKLIREKLINFSIIDWWKLRHTQQGAVNNGKPGRFPLFCSAFQTSFWTFEHYCDLSKIILIFQTSFWPLRRNTHLYFDSHLPRLHTATNPWSTACIVKKGIYKRMLPKDWLAESTWVRLQRNSCGDARGWPVKIISSRLVFAPREGNNNKLQQSRTRSRPRSEWSSSQKMIVASSLWTLHARSLVSLAHYTATADTDEEPQQIPPRSMFQPQYILSWRFKTSFRLFVYPSHA